MGRNPTSDTPAEGFAHDPVMVAEVVELFAPVPHGVVIDATVGGGGHAVALLEARSDLTVLGLDRDPAAVAAAAGRLRPYGLRARVRRARFDGLAEEAAGDPGPVVGVLFDLGVSSPQLDRPERGFSYRQPGPLDMRMEPDRGRSALALVNEATVGELADLFRANGEGRLAGRLARAVVAARPLTSTTELADVVAAAVPAAARRRGHPARRVFQALRIAVNEELEQLDRVLPVALDLLVPGGRCVAIAYHSGEDRLVKQAFARAAAGGCTCPPDLPCVCGARPTHRLVFRGARRPGADEVARNRRAESARLRAAERLEDAAP
jgi:16S rRNA (cytosine1402-N4)-methyltransferase